MFRAKRLKRWHRSGNQKGRKSNRLDSDTWHWASSFARVFLSETLSDKEREFALGEFKRLFAKGDVLDRARQAYCKAQ